VPQICDTGQTALLPFRRKACWGFLLPKKSDGFCFVFLVFFFCPILLVSCTLLVWNCSGIRRKTACCGFFHYENSDGFGRERTRDLGFQRPARKPRRPGMNPRSSVSEASTLTSRQPKTLKVELYLIPLWAMGVLRGTFTLTISNALFCTYHGFQDKHKLFSCYSFAFISRTLRWSFIKFWAGIAQSVQQLATGWTIWGSNPGGVARFTAPPDRSRGPPSLLYNQH
jgi:hypothetical protein